MELCRGQNWLHLLAWRFNMASCRVLFVGIFTLSSCFLNSRGVLLLRGMLFFFLVSQFTIVRGASTLHVPLQVFAWAASSLRVGRLKSSRGASSPFSSLRQRRFQSCDAQRTYDSLINILHLMININNPKVKTSPSFCQTQK